MMRRRTTLLTGCTALVLALGATACGGDPVSAGGGDKALDGQTVTVAGVWTGTEQKNFQKVLDAFSEKTGAKTTFVSTGDNVSTVVGSKIEGGNAPDVVMVPQVGVLKQFAQKGWLKPLSATAQKSVDANFAPVWKNYGSVDDTLYGLYFKAAHKSTVWYSPDALAQAGVEPPTSYDDLLKAGRTVSDSGLAAFSVAGQDGWTLTDWFENVYLSQAGPEKYDALATHQLKWTDASVVKALTTLGELFKDKQPEAAAVWAEAGGFLSPNKNVDLASYGDDVTRETAKSLVAAGDSVRFDMSDQAPAAFGGTKGAGEWKLLQDFLRDPSDPKGTAAKLEAAAAKAYEGQG
ncbi:ABC transporter substrate-binding protein [Streptomyces nigra]|uniref:ABC transporter substrate-binding protein n=1 Tax=Streptomyces nigra TaxID=1827580 RepID=UPI0038059A6C